MRVACTVSWRENPGVLTFVMLWPVTASEVLFAASPDRPIFSRSAISQSQVLVVALSTDATAW
ncbi:hypothetical protein D3C78_1713490 [compost metagenome]